MNVSISDFLKTSHSMTKLFIHSTEYESHINISNVLVLSYPDDTIIIDKPIDASSVRTFSTTYVKFNTVINVNTSFTCYTGDTGYKGSIYHKLMQGSYIGTQFVNPGSKDDKHVSGIYINGYVMNNGVLS